MKDVIVWFYLWILVLGLKVVRLGIAVTNWGNEVIGAEVKRMCDV